MYWKTIGEEELKQIQKAFNQTKYPVSDYNVTHLTLWKDSFQMSYAWLGGFLFISGVDLLTRMPFVYMPIGNGPVDAAIKEFLMQSEEEELIIKAITPEMYGELMASPDLKCHYQTDQGEWEYNYLTQKLAYYEGSQLKRKREMCQAFERNYEFSFEPYQEEERKAVDAFLGEWYESFGDHTLMMRAEEEGIKGVLNYYEALSCKGFVVRVEGAIVGFILAEPLNEEILVVHYEKGNRMFKGIYDIMKRELSRKYMDEYRYLSLEEDMDISGLRRAKKLYAPELMREKGTVICRLDERG